MNREQNRLLDLMKEFDYLCSANGIRYSLSGETLMYAVCCGSLEPRPCYASVIMTASDCRKFIDVFESRKPENRELEYWGNSETYPDYTIRYVASDTTAFNILDYMNYKCHGMFIEIQILRGDDCKEETKRMNALEKGITLNSFNENIGISSIRNDHDKKANRYYKAMTLRSGKAGVRKQLFDYFMKECAEPKSLGKGLGGVYTFVNRSRKYRDVSQYYFDHPDKCVIEGHTFPIPSNARILIRMMFDKRYKLDAQGDHVEDSFRYIDNCIVDPDMPYRDAFKNMSLSKEDLLAVRRDKERIEAINDLNKDNNYIVREDWHTVRQTDARFRMWKYYMPLKEEIFKMYEARDYRALEMIFWDYTEELSAMRKIGRSFSFDNELLGIYIRLLEHKGMFEEADRIIKQMPKSHWEEIKIGQTEA